MRGLLGSGHILGTLKMITLLLHPAMLWLDVILGQVQHLQGPLIQGRTFLASTTANLPATDEIAAYVKAETTTAAGVQHTPLHDTHASAPV